MKEKPVEEAVKEGTSEEDTVEETPANEAVVETTA